MVNSKEILTYRLNHNDYVESVGKMVERTSKVIETSNNVFSTLYVDLEVFDNATKSYKKVLKLNKNENDEWLELNFSQGRTLVVTPDQRFKIAGSNELVEAGKLVAGQKIEKNSIVLPEKETLIDVEEAYLLGRTLFNKEVVTDIIPRGILLSSAEIKQSFLQGIVDENSFIHFHSGKAYLGGYNKEVYLQLMYLFESVGCTTLFQRHLDRYNLEIFLNDNFSSGLRTLKKDVFNKSKKFYYNVEKDMIYLGCKNVDSRTGYAIKVASGDGFTVSGIEVF